MCALVSNLSFSLVNNFNNPILHLCRSLNSNRSNVAKVKRNVFLRSYPTTFVHPDGSTFEARYKLPRQIIKLPVDLDNCTDSYRLRIRHLRRPREKRDVKKTITSEFDPMKYIKN